ncbi:MAG: hypothetical protein HYS25_09405 [Ignavibacteriales bacterium]|nr:hypothetical protein [Ignavibacteriales bacterium]
MKCIPQIKESNAVEVLKKRENIFQREKNVRRSELIYLPYYLFSFNIYLADGKVESSFVCVDLIGGECAHLRDKTNIVQGNKTAEFNNVITENEAAERARKFIINEILHKKKKYLNFLTMEIKLETVLEYPYWIGYFQKKNGIDFNVIDGITGQKQGPKMKTIFIKFLMQ